MVKFLLPALGLAILVGCQVDSTNVSENESKEKQQERLQKLKQERQKLDQEIDRLEKSLGRSDTTAADGAHTLVNTRQLKSHRFEHYVEVHGNVEARHNLRIAPEINGKISKIHVKEGERVQKDQVLAELDKELIRKQIEEVRTSLDLARDIYQRQKNLWEQDIGSEVEYLKAKNEKQRLERKLSTLRTRLEKTALKAPVSGTVDKIYLEEGEMAGPAQPFMQVVNLQDLSVEANLSEAHLGKVKPGDTVLVHFPSLDRDQKEVVRHVGQIISPNDRTFPVKVSLHNPDSLLKPNVLTRLKVNDITIDSALTVPSQVIQQDIRGDYLYKVTHTNGTPVARKVYVKIGPVYEGNSVIKNGLEPGDTVVTQGFNDVSDGDRLKIQSSRISNVAS